MDLKHLALDHYDTPSYDVGVSVFDGLGLRVAISVQLVLHGGQALDAFLLKGGQPGLKRLLIKESGKAIVSPSIA